MSRARASDSMIASRYASAIFDLAQHAGNAQEVVQQFAALKDALLGNAAAICLLKNAAASRDDKAALLMAALKGAHALTLNSVRVIAGHGRAAQICAIAEALQARLSEQSGEIEAIVTYAGTPADVQTQAVTALIARFTGKTPRITTATNADLIGGFTAAVGSHFIDASVSTALENIRRRLEKAA